MSDGCESRVPSSGRRGRYFLWESHRPGESAASDRAKPIRQPPKQCADYQAHGIPLRQGKCNKRDHQRDFFGAHTYERTDKPEGQMFHTEWPEVIG